MSCAIYFRKIATYFEISGHPWTLEMLLRVIMFRIVLTSKLFLFSEEPQLENNNEPAELYSFEDFTPSPVSSKPPLPCKADRHLYANHLWAQVGHSPFR